MLRQIRTCQDLDELQDLARQQIELRALVLEERAENLRRLAAHVHHVQGWDTYQALMKRYDIDDEDNKELTALGEIADNWPWIAHGPGGGYW